MVAAKRSPIPYENGTVPSQNSAENDFAESRTVTYDRERNGKGKISGARGANSDEVEDSGSERHEDCTHESSATAGGEETAERTPGDDILNLVDLERRDRTSCQHGERSDLESDASSEKDEEGGDSTNNESDGKERNSTLERGLRLGALEEYGPVGTNRQNEAAQGRERTDQ